jgi:hypothetical protein
MSQSASAGAKAASSSALTPLMVVGARSFFELVTEGSIFVDKSLLIKSFYEEAGRALLMTFPRRWGKSINLDMIRTFFSIEADINGERLSLAERRNQKIFRGGQVELANGQLRNLSSLEIAKDEQMMSLQGRFPVIRIDFKNTKANNFAEVLENVKVQLQATFSEHEYLLKSSRLDSDKRYAFKSYCRYKKYKLLTLPSVKVGLSLLSSLLKAHWGKESIILIDEYDAAINNAFKVNMSEEDMNDTLDLFRSINEATFKTNENLHRGILTGVFRIAKANLFSGLNNLIERNITDSRYSHHYGFTQKDVDYLLQKYGVLGKQAEDIKDWYNGYIVGDVEIYNPWSIVNCLTDMKTDGSQSSTMIFRSYWEESGNINFMKPLLKNAFVKEEIEQLIRNEPIYFPLEMKISSDDYKVLKDIIKFGSNYEVNTSASGVLFSYLFAAGYLTGNEIDGCKLPNKELKIEFQRMLLTHYQSKYKIKEVFFRKVTDELQRVIDSETDEETDRACASFGFSLVSLLSQLDDFKKLKDSSLQCLSDFVNGNENIVQCIMTYVVLQLITTNKVGTEVNLGGGRADIVLVCKEFKKAVVIELKYREVSSAEDIERQRAKLEAKSEEAIAQIINRKYAREMSGLWETILIGLSVSSEKGVAVLWQKLPVRVTSSDNSGTN